MKTKNEVLMLTASMMVFFRIRAEMALDLLSNEEYDSYRDLFHDVNEELYVASTLSYGRKV